MGIELKTLIEDTCRQIRAKLLSGRFGEAQRPARLARAKMCARQLRQRNKSGTGRGGHCRFKRGRDWVHNTAIARLVLLFSRCSSSKPTLTKP
jgi:hypothetical protein